MPFVVAVNRFDGPSPSLERVREALALPDDIPMLDCDARERGSAKEVLISLVQYLTRLTEETLAAAAG
jgi:signal recognition particle receptor subunit beta